MINRLIIILLLLAVNQFSTGSAHAVSFLKAVNRADEANHLQLFFHFDQVPVFTTTTIGRKVDLILENTILNEPLATPTLDGKIIKITRERQKTKALLSFYFRYPPQKITTESDKETATLILDILPGVPPSSIQSELSSKQRNYSVAEQDVLEALNPVKLSGYAKDWLSFFTEYESEVTINVPPKFLLPPFPLAIAIQPQMAVQQWLPDEIRKLADENKWTQVCHLLRQQVAIQPDEKLKERLVLTYAEALVREGKYREPYFLLQKIALQYPDTLMASLARFLFIYQQAVQGDPVSSYYDMKTLFKTIKKDIPFTASFNVLLAELALMTGLPTEAGQLLDRDDVVHSEALKNIRLLRQADLLYAKNEKDKALRAYSELADQSSVIDSGPLSLANFSDVLYADKRFQEAADKYRLLSNQLNKKPQLDLALFRLAMSQLHLPETEKKAAVDLQQIQLAFPHTEGGTRALLKRTDLDFVSKRITSEAAQSVYHSLADNADTIPLREEAAFKRALVNALSGKHQASVAQCMKILRDFQAGKLRLETKALLIEQVPKVINQLISDKKYIEALVLAKQNKTFFARGWFDSSLLYTLADAYSKLGLAEQTAQTYQYLFEISNDKEKEKIFLPLIQTLFAAGRDGQVEEYADRYLLKYPKGNDAEAIFQLKCRALYESGQLKNALKILNSETRHQSPQLELLKAQVYFDLKQWQDVIETLTKPELQKVILTPHDTLVLAESYFQNSQYALAGPLFRRIIEQKGGTEQAQFRLAQIALKTNNTKQSLNLFKELAEKGKESLWTKLAAEEAAILQLQE